MLCLLAISGRIVVAIRSNELRTELLGYDARFYKLITFVIGAGIASLAGILFVNWGSFIGPTVFSIYFLSANHHLADGGWVRDFAGSRDGSICHPMAYNLAWYQQNCRPKHCSWSNFYTFHSAGSERNSAKFGWLGSVSKQTARADGEYA